MNKPEQPNHLDLSYQGDHDNPKIYEANGLWEVLYTSSLAHCSVKVKTPDRAIYIVNKVREELGLQPLNFPSYKTRPSRKAEKKLNIRADRLTLHIRANKNKDIC